MSESADQVIKRIVAFHEAGHAVAAELAGCGVARVFIERDGTQRWHGGVQLFPRSRPAFLAYATCLLGGVAAGHLATGAKRIVRRHAGPGADLALLRDTARARSLDDDQVLLVLARATHRAMLLLAYNWPAVEGLAEELVRGHSLDGEEARRAMRAALKEARATGTAGGSAPAWPVPFINRSSIGPIRGGCGESLAAGSGASHTSSVNAPETYAHGGRDDVSDRQRLSGAQGDAPRAASPQCVSQADRPSQTEEGLRRDIALRPEDPALWVLLGRVLEGATQSDEALQAYRRAIDLDPAGAALELEQVVVADPECAAAWSALGRARCRAGAPEAAVQACERTLALDATVMDAWFHLGLAFSSLGRRDEATRAWLGALALRPSSNAVWANLGHALSCKRQHAQAVAAHRAAILLGADNPDVWANLVIDLIEMVLQGHGEYAYMKAIEAGPLDPDLGALLTAALGDRAVPMHEG
jgi:Flp pilus assembly protein TadD